MLSFETSKPRHVSKIEVIDGDQVHLCFQLARTEIKLDPLPKYTQVSS